MAEATITISEELRGTLEEYAEAAGYSSADEFAAVILQREIDRLEDADASDKIEDRLRGLGYIS